MTLHLLIAWGALIASVLLLFFSTTRLLGGIATAAALLELAMAYGYIRVNLASIPLGLVFPLLLVVPGVLAWLRAGSKPAVSASAIVSFAGLVQLLSYFSSHPV